jgi:hypothetical protein
VNADSRNFHNDSTNESPTTAASRKEQMREANVVIPLQYTHQDGASTSGHMHQDGTTTSGSAQQRHQDANGNEPRRHQDIAPTGGSVSLRTASDRKGGARSDRPTGSRQLSLAYRTPSPPPVDNRSPMVHEDSGIRGLELPASDDLLHMAELPPLYSVE